MRSHLSLPLSTEKSRKGNDRFIVGLFLVFWAIYQKTVTRQYSYDGLCYALDVDFGGVANRFHPNHMLYTFISWSLVQFFQKLGYHGRSIFLMQSVNAFVGAAAVGTFAWVLSRRFSWMPTLLAAAAFGLSQAVWTEVTDPGCYAWTALVAVLLVELLCHAKKIRAFWLGIAHGLGVLFHQMLVLAAPAFLSETSSPLQYLAGVSVGAGIPYALVVATFHPGTVHEMLFWLFGAAGASSSIGFFGAWWSFQWISNLKVWGTTLAESFVPSTGWVLHPWACGAIVSALLISVAMGTWKERRLPTRALWFWILAFGIFEFFFNPGALRFRILVMPPLLFLAARAVGAADTKPSRVMYGILSIAIVVAACFTFENVINPHASPQPEEGRLAWVAAHVRPNDLFVYAAEGSTSTIPNVYLTYFAREIDAQSLKGYLFSHPNADGVVFQRRLEWTAVAHRTVWIESSLLTGAVQSEIETLHKIPAGTLALWLHDFVPADVHRSPEGYSLTRLQLRPNAAVGNKL